MLTKKRVAAVLLILIVAASLVILVTYAVHARVRTRRLASRPIVMIHSPHNGEQIALGRGITVHATARSPEGVTRVELWVDDQLTSARESEDLEPSSLFVFNTTWQAASSGKHSLIVRAFSKSGFEGRATVVVEAVGGDLMAGWFHHIVEDGESVETIAADYGVNAEDIERFNPSPGPGGPAVGDELTFPPPSDDPPGSQEEGEPAEDEELLDLEFVDSDGIPHEIPSTGNPIALRFEALALETDRAYEALHCYIGLGNRTPLWYPDVDGDQTTDESFASLGPGSWDVARQLSGNAGLFAFWPDDQDLAFDALCVGILGGGTDAVEVGRLTLSIPSEHWDGVTRQAMSDGGEGSFTLDYRVSLEEMQMIELDRDMAVPYDLWIDDRRTSLHWSYEPTAEEDPPISGFLVFVNDILVWSAPRDARESRIPDQWFYPPCDTAYEFTVRAYVQPYPDGPYSLPSEPVTISHGDFGREGCERSYSVTMLSLETGDLGIDGDRDPGDMGPVYGSFYVNDKVVSFDDTRETEWNVGVLRDIGGLLHNWTYNLDDLAWTWLSASNTFGVDLGEGEAITLGFDITDADTGWNNEDDPVCHGETILDPHDLTAGATLEGHIDAGPVNSAGIPRCRVRYVARPILGGPVGYGGSALPLPWLDVVRTTVEPDTGLLQIHLHNTGTAAWANHDLRILLAQRSGEEVANVVLREMYFDPMDEPYVYTFDGNLRGFDPMSICVTLDPDNEVLERYEHSGALVGHGRYCPNLPDLVITDAQFNAGDGSLLVSVQNTGEAAIENGEIELLITHDDGSGRLLPSHPGDELDVDSWETVEILWPGSQLERDSMDEGYILTVDPNEHIFESDEDNNDFTVRSGARLRVDWQEAHLTWYPTLSVDDCHDYATHNTDQEQTVYVNVAARTAISNRSIASWTTTQAFRWPGSHNAEWEQGTYRTEFDIAGEEQLVIDVSGELSNDSMGSGTAIFLPEDNWGAAVALPSSISCQDGTQVIGLTPTENGWFACGGWSVTVEVCDLH